MIPSPIPTRSEGFGDADVQSPFPTETLAAESTLGVESTLAAESTLAVESTLTAESAAGTEDDNRDDERDDENEAPVRETNEATEAPEEFEVDDEDEALDQNGGDEDGEDDDYEDTDADAED